jgi:hypothetical protein
LTHKMRARRIYSKILAIAILKWKKSNITAPIVITLSTKRKTQTVTKGQNRDIYVLEIELGFNCRRSLDF